MQLSPSVAMMGGMSGIRAAQARIDSQRNTWCCKRDGGEWYACTEAESHHDVGWRWCAGSAYGAAAFVAEANQPVGQYVQLRDQMVRSIVDRNREPRFT